MHGLDTIKRLNAEAAAAQLQQDDGVTVGSVIRDLLWAAAQSPRGLATPVVVLTDDGYIGYTGATPTVAYNDGKVVIDA